MTTTTAAPTSFRKRPMAALAKAEYLQFRRNKTLIVMGTIFPIALPLVIFFIGRNGSDPLSKVTFTAFEEFTLMALLFVQFYSVLSMITTRRGEGVLKRLRTGEAADWQIQAAPAVPGLLLTGVGAVIVAGVAYGAGSPAPVNVIALLIALAAGIVIFALLALATSAVTKNAEAAQITSLPVMVIAVVGLSSIRNTLPDRLADVVDRTPFAAISDLVSLGVRGKLASAGDSAAANDFAGTFHAMGGPLVTLAAWAVVALVLARKYFKWDDRG